MTDPKDALVEAAEDARAVLNQYAQAYATGTEPDLSRATPAWAKLAIALTAHQARAPASLEALESFLFHAEGCTPSLCSCGLTKAKEAIGDRISDLEGEVRGFSVGQERYRSAWEETVGKLEAAEAEVKRLAIYIDESGQPTLSNGITWKARAEAAEAQLAAQEDAQPYKDALHDLVMLKAQDDIGCVPAPTREWWDTAWGLAEELTRNEP